jgi:hypothetical protein
MRLDLIFDVSLLLLAWIVCTLLLVLIARLAIGTFSPTQDDEFDVRTANARAEELLRDLLDESELRQLKEQRFLDVASPGYAQRIYRVPLGEGMVRVYEGGKEVFRLCIQPVNSLPRYDVVAMHILMIAGNEQEYLARANWFPPLSSMPGPVLATGSLRI